MKMTNLFRQPAIIVPLAGLLMASPITQAANETTQNQPAASLSDAFTDGTVNFQFRYRFENVDQDNALQNANASTLKSRIIFQTREYRDFTALVEVDDVTNIGDDNHNTTRNGMTDHSTVADPEGTEINQVWIQYSGIPDTKAKYGRQRINLDNERFVGGVGWRQNEQTYDGLTLTNTALANTQVTYAYVDNINRVFGPDSGTPDEDLDSNIHALNISYSGFALGKITAYGYLFEIDDAQSLSTETYGVRFDGKQQRENISFLYTAEYARQEDYGDNPLSYDVDYWMLEAGAVVSGITAKVGQETLEGDLSKGIAFSTPLATLHKFQGWADQFLNTPAGGIEDLQFTLSTQVLGATWMAVYHDFEAEDGGANYGDELDISVARKFGKVGALLKYAAYDADEFGVDTDKVWLQLQVDF